MLRPRPYLESTRFTVRSDLDTLKWILNLSDSSKKLARWNVRLSELDFDVVNKAGVKHQAADALIRLHIEGNAKNDSNDDPPVCNVKITHVMKEELPFVHVCTECVIENDPVTGKPIKAFIQTGASIVQPTERQ